MIYISTCIVITIITVLILRNTHVIVYNRYSKASSVKAVKIDEFDFKVPIWLILLILILGLIPGVNVVLYTIWYIIYIVHAAWNPNKLFGCIHKFTFKKATFITIISEKIWKFLNTCY